ncbi:hypothetical protein EVAR_36970_1 [Eumeta japonica]|uniref:Reverse transcriptase domain-containing protein n=1 Tax=Eumeta variegata TaxID=151549 RepID=A0A4C1WAH7_EUMVA|nr:hypothetical protein EVAR_36970_1 [Eumeta japonica]
MGTQKVRGKMRKSGCSELEKYRARVLFKNNDECQKGIALPWLFYIFIESLHNLKQYEYGQRTDELSVKCLLYADAQVILLPLACELQKMVNKMDDSVKIKGRRLLVPNTAWPASSGRIGACASGHDITPALGRECPLYK